MRKFLKVFLILNCITAVILLIMYAVGCWITWRILSPPPLDEISLITRVIEIGLIGIAFFISLDPDLNI
jgi:hypothetical protein